MQKKIINVLDLSIQRRQLILLKIIFRLRNVISIESKKFLTHRLNLNEKNQALKVFFIKYILFLFYIA